MKRFVGLSVSIDGEPPVCIACAERCANDGGFAHLFWMANRPQRCDGTTSCPECGERMDGEKAQEAAVRVAALLKANSATCAEAAIRFTLDPESGFVFDRENNEWLTTAEEVFDVLSPLLPNSAICAEREAGEGEG